MINNLPRVLVISSVDPYDGAGIVALNHYQALKKGGLDVDFLTKYPVENYPDFISVYDRKPGNGVLSLFSKFKNRVIDFLSLNPLKKQVSGYFFFYKKETNPQVPVKKVLAKIEKKYDVVYIMFWQGMLSFATIYALYNKLQCQFQFRCVDYSPMSGGCHFSGECQRFIIGCGKCPGIRSNRDNDFTRWNVVYRKKVYEIVKPVVYGNTFMNTFYRKSYLLRDYDRCEIALPLIDSEEYKPMPMLQSRKKYDIDDDKRFVIFIASQNLSDDRKGIKYLLNALKTLYDRMQSKEKAETLLVLAGHNIDSIKDHLYFDYKYLGFVKQTDLPEIYSMSNVFLSPSVNDAGPSMVNQSMACGTPVVSFEMGTALDVILGKNTGYCAKLRNSDDFAKGIESIFHLPSNDYAKLRERCREVALQLTSQESFVRNFLKVYEKYR